MEPLNDLVVRARAGDFEAYGGLVEATQTMAYAVAVGVLRDSTLAQDAVQEAYLRAFRRLGDLQEPAAFVSWLRRIVITVALNMPRARRLTLFVVNGQKEKCHRACDPAGIPLTAPLQSSDCKMHFSPLKRLHPGSTLRTYPFAVSRRAF